MFKWLADLFEVESKPKPKSHRPKFQIVHDPLSTNPYRIDQWQEYWGDYHCVAFASTREEALIKIDSIKNKSETEYID